MGERGNAMATEVWRVARVVEVAARVKATKAS